MISSDVENRDRRHSVGVSSGPPDSQERYFVQPGINELSGEPPIFDTTNINVEPDPTTLTPEPLLAPSVGQEAITPGGAAIPKPSVVRISKK